MGDSDRMNRPDSRASHGAWIEDVTMGELGTESGSVATEGPRSYEFSSDARHKLQRGLGSSQGVGGGYDLPPINSALVGGDSTSPHFSSTRFTEFPPPAPKNSYRSGSVAPSRTQSPVSHIGSVANQGQTTPASNLILPPPHPLLQASGRQGRSSSPQSTSHSLQSRGYREMAPSNAPIPTIAELERHYRILEEQRRSLEDMMEKNKRMMEGVKRGLEEMRLANTQGNNSPKLPSSESRHYGGSVPLNRGERTRDSGHVWPVAQPESSAREQRGSK